MKKSNIKDENKIIRAVLYIRVSTEEQAKHGYSINSQKDRLTEFCKEQGYIIVKTYADEGKSARSKLSNRKALLELIEDAKLDRFDRIVIWRLDRWFRNIADYYKVQEVLDKHNVDWECSDEEYDTYTSNGRLYLNIKLSIAQNESDQTGDRIRFNFENMIKNKRPVYGSQSFPLGLVVVGEKQNKRVIIDEETKHIVYDMFNSIEMTGSIRKTLNYINEKYNLSICYNSIRNYLKNELYYGFYRGVSNYCEAYIDKERYDKIQQLISKNNKDNKKNCDYVFSGLIKCCKCGNTLAGCFRRSKREIKDGTKKVYKYPYYRCNKHWKSRICDNKKIISQNKLEKWLLENFETSLKKKIVELEDFSDAKNNIIKNSKKKLDSLLSKLERLNDLYIDGKISKDKYQTEYNQCKQEINSLQTQNEENHDLSKYKNILNSYNGTEFYNKLDDIHKNLFWKKYIQYIIEDESNKFIIFFN